MTGTVLDGDFVVLTAVRPPSKVYVRLVSDLHGQFGLYLPVVRCRDCERFAVDKSDHEYRSGWWCTRWSTDMVKPDGFCAWGERKADV